MTADEFFRAGRLAEAIQAQTELVRGKPADQDERFLLFVLLSFAGELERAEKQLDVLGNQDERAQTGSLVYRALLGAELERRNVFAGRSRPVLPPDSPAWMDARIEALALVREGEFAAAEARIDAAVEATPPHAGSFNGRPFAGMRDLDDVLGSVLEVFAGGRYLWLPLDHIVRLELSEPETALDTLWIPAALKDSRGESAQVHIPALYAGTHEQPDDDLRLGRRTEWHERGELYVGIGQRILLVAGDGEPEEHPVTSLRTLELGDESGDGA